MKDDELRQSLIIDLRRGTLVLAVLCFLREAKYGYSLLQEMEEQGLHVEAGTLYPLLRRLEKQGLLTSDWDTRESRPRKYYRLSERGVSLCSDLTREWQILSTEMGKLVRGGK